MKKMIKLRSILISACLALSACAKKDPFPVPQKDHPADVATEWMKLNMRLTMTTPGFNSIVSGRSFGYAGLTLYQSVAAGSVQGQSLVTQLNGGNALRTILPAVNKQ